MLHCVAFLFFCLISATAWPPGYYRIFRYCISFRFSSMMLGWYCHCLKRMKMAVTEQKIKKRHVAIVQFIASFHFYSFNCLNIHNILNSTWFIIIYIVLFCLLYNAKYFHGVLNILLAQIRVFFLVSIIIGVTNSKKTGLIMPLLPLRQLAFLFKNRCFITFILSIVSSILQERNQENTVGVGRSLHHHW